MRIASLTDADSGFDSAGQATIGRHIVSAYHHILTDSPLGHGSVKINDVAE
jgi:hypothetical protein